MTWLSFFFYKDLSASINMKGMPEDIPYGKIDNDNLN